MPPQNLRRAKRGYAAHRLPGSLQGGGGSACQDAFLSHCPIKSSVVATKLQRLVEALQFGGEAYVIAHPDDLTSFADRPVQRRHAINMTSTRRRSSIRAACEPGYFYPELHAGAPLAMWWRARVPLTRSEATKVRWKELFELDMGPM